MMADVDVPGRECEFCAVANGICRGWVATDGETPYTGSYPGCAGPRIYLGG